MKTSTVRKILTPSFHFFRRVKYAGIENIPKQGPVIFIANHQGLIDPFLIGYNAPDMIHWMAKKELFKNKFVAWFISSMGAYPIDRSSAADMQSKRTTTALLNDGKFVGMFPQGTRAKKGKPLPKAKPGFVRYALESNAVIQPVSISGKNHIFGKMFVRYGTPFKVPADLEKSLFTDYAQTKLDEIYNMAEVPFENSNS